jgi:hypothetical protein
MTTLEVAFVLAAFVLVLAVDAYTAHRAKVNRRNARRLDALRGIDPYETEWNWRRNHG